MMNVDFDSTYRYKEIDWYAVYNLFVFFNSKEKKEN